MTEIIIKKLYDNEIELAWYPNSHSAKLNGECLISVTAATGMVDKSGVLIHWATKLAENYLIDVKESGSQISLNDVREACSLHRVKKEQAAEIGKIVHKWAEDYAKGNNPELPSDDTPDGEKVLNGVLAFLKWVDENKIKFVETERMVYSKKYGYFGWMDLAFTKGTEDHKIFHFGDYKTGGGIYPEMRYQVRGYNYAYMEEMGNKLTIPIGSSFILRFAKEDKFNKLGELIESAGTFEVAELPVEEMEKDFNCFLGCLALKKRDKELSIKK